MARGRQRESELRANIQSTLDVDFSALRTHQMLHDREPEPRTAEHARPSRVNAIKALEDSIEIVFRDPDPGIRNDNLEHGPLGLDRDVDPRSWVGIPRCIADEVREDLFERPTICDADRFPLHF